MFGWTRQFPASTPDKDWFEIAASGNKMILRTDLSSARLYAFDGAAWAETQPKGNVNANWRTVGISGDNMIVTEYATRYLYTFNGSSWTARVPYGGVTGQQWTSAAISGNNIIAFSYSDTGTSIMFSNDLGATWAAMADPAVITQAEYILSISGSKMLVVGRNRNTSNARLYYWNGAAWSELQPLGNFDRRWNMVGISGNFMYAVTQNYPSAGLSTMVFSTDLGATWSLMEPLGAGVTIASISAVSMYENRMLATTYQTAVLGQGKLMYFNGVYWAEQQPTGASASWMSTAITPTKKVAVGHASGISTGVGAYIQAVNAGFDGGGALTHSADGGIYTLGRYDKKYPAILDMSYPVSENTTAQVEIGAIMVVGEDFYASWKRVDGPNTYYGVDKIDYTAKYASPTLETRVLTGNRQMLASFKDYILAYTELPAGTGYTLFYSTDYGMTWTEITLTTDTMRKILSGENVVEATVLQLQLNATVSGNDSPALEKMRINIA